MLKMRKSHGRSSAGLPHVSMGHSLALPRQFVTLEPEPWPRHETSYLLFRACRLMGSQGPELELPQSIQLSLLKYGKLNTVLNVSRTFLARLLSCEVLPAHHAREPLCGRGRRGGRPAQDHVDHMRTPCSQTDFICDCCCHAVLRFVARVWGRQLSQLDVSSIGMAL